MSQADPCRLPPPPVPEQFSGTSCLQGPFSEVSQLALPSSITLGQVQGCLPLVVTVLHVAAQLLEQLQHLHLAIACCLMHGSAAAVVLMVKVDAMLYEVAQRLCLEVCTW